MCVYCENQVFLIVLSMTGNQSKTKTILHTVSETFINTNSRYKTQKSFMVDSLKNIWDSSHSKRSKKDAENGEKWKTKSIIQV